MNLNKTNKLRYSNNFTSDFTLLNKKFKKIYRNLNISKFHEEIANEKVVNKSFNIFLKIFKLLLALLFYFFIKAIFF